MPTPSSLALFAGAALVLLLIPGPAVLYVVTRSASQGRRAGLVSVIGLHTGTVVHVAAALAGLSAVLASSAAAFTVVKYAGAAYLVFLGVRTLLYRSQQAGVDGLGADRTLGRVYADAVVVNVLNPKTALFFLAFVPQFVRPEAGSAATQILVLSGLFILLGLLSDGAYALSASWLRERLLRGGAHAPLLSGIAYLGLGMATALSGDGRS